MHVNHFFSTFVRFQDIVVYTQRLMVIQFSIGESLYQVYRLHTVQAGERKNSGKPNLVTPSLAKLDLETLKRDIPNKYLQNMPQAASDA